MYKVDLKSSSQESFIVKSKEYEMLIGIKGKGMTPPDTLLASLASCVGVYIRKYAQSAKLDIGEFSITAEADFAKEPPYRFADISVKIQFDKALTDEKRKKAIIDFVHNCPVHNTLKANPLVNVEII